MRERSRERGGKKQGERNGRGKIVRKEKGREGTVKEGERDKMDEREGR